MDSSKETTAKATKPTATTPHHVTFHGPWWVGLVILLLAGAGLLWIGLRLAG